MLRATVTVTLKGEVSDPQGIAVCEAIQNLHPGLVSKVRQGKIFEIDLEETDPERAKAEIDKVANELLANVIIENYDFEIEEVNA